MEILKLNNVTKSFERRNETIQPLDGLDFSMDQGDYAVIMGRSGTGKSTLLNVIALFLDVDGGDIYFDGERINDLDDEEASRYRNLKIGYLMQNLQTFSSLSVIENVVLPNHMHEPDPDAETRALEALEKLGILDLKDEDVSSLSGGEQKRVSIARSLINEPEILILDEPTSDLDERTAEGIKEILVDLNEAGTSILVVTHDPDFLNYGKHNYEIRSGKLHFMEE